MRILVVGPAHERGSLPPYVDLLAASLRGLGAGVDRVGSRELPVDPERGQAWTPERVVAAADQLLAGVDLEGYDVVSLHFGNDEVEQLVPVRWRGRARPPAVYHVHATDWELFARKVPDAGWYRAVREGVASVEGLVYFGEYARRVWAGTPAGRLPGVVSFFPTTIPEGTRPPGELPGAVGWLAGAPRGVVRASLYGFASPWKDVAGLLRAFEQVRARVRFLLVGPLWDRPGHAGVDLAGAVWPGWWRVGGVEVSVWPGWLDAPGRVGLVGATEVAVLPYRPHGSFQGSGAVADYLAGGVPVVACEAGNMRELVGPAGVVVPAGAPAALGGALERVAGDGRVRARLAAAARRRAGLFSPAAHAAACLAFYQQLATTPPGRPGRQGVGQRLP